MRAALEAKSRGLKPTQVQVRRADGSVKMESRTGQHLETRPQVETLIEAAKDPLAAQVAPYLYLGSQDAAENLAGLEQAGIRAILNCAFSDEPFPGRFEYLRLSLYDTDEQELNIESHLDFLRAQMAQERNVLVHCNAGVSRSATVCIAYLIVEHGLTFDQALAQTKAARPSIRPNAGFVAQLKRI